MNKCSPVEMRKSLQIVEQFKQHGIDFVPIPVKSEDHKIELISMGNDVFEQILKESGDE